MFFFSVPSIVSSLLRLSLASSHVIAGEQGAMTARGRHAIRPCVGRAKPPPPASSYTLLSPSPSSERATYYCCDPSLNSQQQRCDPLSTRRVLGRLRFAWRPHESRLSVSLCLSLRSSSSETKTLFQVIHSLGAKSHGPRGTREQRCCTSANSQGRAGCHFRPREEEPPLRSPHGRYPSQQRPVLRSRGCSVGARILLSPEQQRGADFSGRRRPGVCAAASAASCRGGGGDHPLRCGRLDAVRWAGVLGIWRGGGVIPEDGG